MSSCVPPCCSIKITLRFFSSIGIIVPVGAFVLGCGVGAGLALISFALSAENVTGGSLLLILGAIGVVSPFTQGIPTFGIPVD